MEKIAYYIERGTRNYFDVNGNCIKSEPYESFYKVKNLTDKKETINNDWEERKENKAAC